MDTAFQIEQMTLEEKLRMMEALWDDLCRHDAVSMPQWHKDVLDERQRLVEDGKANFIDRETAKKQIRDLVRIADGIANRRGGGVLFTGTAGVPPAGAPSGATDTPEAQSPTLLALRARGGRDARGPSEAALPVMREAGRCP